MQSDGQEGIAPSNHLEEIALALVASPRAFVPEMAVGHLLSLLADCAQAPSEQGSDATTPARAILARGKFDYAAADGFQFAAGDLMRVLGKIDENWWAVGKVQGGERSQGIAPVNHMEVVEGDDAQVPVMSACT